MLISVVVPAYNEEEVLPEFQRRLVSVLDTLEHDVEIVYANDGSTDGTIQVLKELARQDPRVVIVDLSRNFGKEVALTAGIDHACGDAIVVIDADLQDPPELIPRMIELWQSSNDVVYAQRTSRAGESFLKKFTASMFYRVANSIGERPIPADTGDFRLMSRRAVDGLKQLRERHRFMKGLFTWIGYNQIALPYERNERFAGNTKFNYWKLWNFSIEGFTSFTIAPLKSATYVGLFSAFMAIMYGVYMVARTILYGNPLPGYPSLIVIVLFLGGAQLMVLGIIGEYLGRTFNEVKGRPLYLIKEVITSQPVRRVANPQADLLAARNVAQSNANEG